LFCTAKLVNAGNVGLTGAAITSPAVNCPSQTLEPGMSAANCTVTVTSTHAEFEQGSMWLNMTAEAINRADNVTVVTGHAEHLEQLTVVRQLTVTSVAEPSSMSSAGMAHDQSKDDMVAIYFKPVLQLSVNRTPCRLQLVCGD
jgi:hypothetical protein